MTYETVKNAYQAAAGRWTTLDWPTSETPTPEQIESVESDARAAEEAAAEALEEALEGRWDSAERAAQRASRLESQYGDDPVWGGFRAAVEAAAEAHREGE